MKVNLDSDKLYYSIGEVSDIFGVSNSLVRYWEGEFTQLKPKKDTRGDRKFTKKDIEVIEIIYSLLKEKGYTIIGAKKALRSEIKLSKERGTLISKLEKTKKGLMKLKEKLV